jgi:hypothetical protein
MLLPKAKFIAIGVFEIRQQSSRLFLYWGCRYNLQLATHALPAGCLCPEGPSVDCPYPATGYLEDWEQA